MPSERQISFPNRQGKTLQGVLCGDPEDTACVIMCYPFADERKNSQPAYVRVARALAKRSVASLRFDYFGCGNSEGRFQEASFDVWIGDTLCAFEVAKALGYVEVMCMGLRLGANIAWYAAERWGCCGELLLWNIISDPRAYFASEKKRNGVLNMFGGLRGRQKQNMGTEEDVFDLAGYAVGKQLARDFETLGMIDVSRIEQDKRIRLGLVGMSVQEPNATNLIQGDRLVVAKVRSFWNVPDVRDTQEFVDHTVECFTRCLNERDSL